MSTAPRRPRRPLRPRRVHSRTPAAPRAACSARDRRDRLHAPQRHARGRWASHRRIINGILYRNRTGVPRRDLPARFGKWKAVYDRHRRWSADGTWDNVFAAVLVNADAQGRIDWSMVSVDSTICRSHQHAAGLARGPRGCRERTCAPAAPSRRGAWTFPGRAQQQDASGRGRRAPPTGPADHTGPVRRRPATHPPHGTHPSRPPGRRAPPHPPGPRRRPQGVLLPSQPTLPAQTADQAHQFRVAVSLE